VLLSASGRRAGRPRIVAVDGRSGSGKTAFAERLRTAIPGAQVVHTDDIAWWHSRFGWDDLITAYWNPFIVGSRCTTSHPRGQTVAVQAISTCQPGPRL
jgi:hypothetical protein